MAMILTKTSDKLNVFPGSVLTYSVTLSNVDALLSETNIIFTDLIPVGATFIPDTFTINAIQQIGSNPNIGVAIPNIAPLGLTTVTYKVVIEAQPLPTQIVNTALLVSTLEGTTIPILYQSNSNTVNVVVLDLYKSANKTIVSLTEDLVYTIIISNTGLVTLLNPVFQDILPTCLSFVEGSFHIDGIPNPLEDPTVGVQFTDLLPGDIITVSFRANVSCIPCPPSFNNTASLMYDIDETGLGDLVSVTTLSNETTTIGAISAFKQLSKEEYLKIPCQKPDIEEILSTLVEVEIVNTKIIDTPIMTSLEGQNLTGKKLIIEGILDQKIEYVALLPEQSVHSAHFRVPFSTFIVLPPDFIEENLAVEGVIEDVFTEKIDCRTIFKNVTFLVKAQMCIVCN